MLEPSEAIDIATQVGEGLAEEPGAGTVHRDIEPVLIGGATGNAPSMLPPAANPNASKTQPLARALAMRVNV